MLKSEDAINESRQREQSATFFEMAKAPFFCTFCSASIVIKITHVHNII